MPEIKESPCKNHEALLLRVGTEGLCPNWNAGILEKWVLGYCIVGLMVKFVLTMKLKMDNILKKPLFHHSTIPLFHD